MKMNQIRKLKSNTTKIYKNNQNIMQKERHHTIEILNLK